MEIEGAIVVQLYIEDVRLHGERTNIKIDNGVIESIGPLAGDKKSFDQTIDGSDLLACPSLLNGHTHASMTLFRGFGDDLPLQQWLEEKIWPREALLDHDMVYWGTRLAILEMIQTGTTFFNDMYWEFDAICEAVEDSGVRAMVSGVFIDQFDEEMAEQQRNRNKELFQRIDELTDRVQFALGPHSIYTVSPESLRWIGEFSREHDLPVHIHLSETKKEVENCQEQHGKTPVEYLDDLSFLHENVIAAHALWLTDSDIEIMAEQDVSVIYNPLSNLKLTAGDDFPYQKLKEAGVTIGLGTDGVASNNNLNLWEEIKMASLIQKNRQKDATTLPAQEAFGLATYAPAEIFGLNSGRIQEGANADLVLLRENHPSLSLSDIHNEASHLAYAMTPDAIDTVVVGGEILMENGTIGETDEILEAFQHLARELCHG